MKGSSQKKCEWDEPKRREDEFEVKMEGGRRIGDASDTGQENLVEIELETRKDPNSPAIRCRLCALEVNTGDTRSDTFAATPSDIRVTDFELGSELQAHAVQTRR